MILIQEQKSDVEPTHDTLDGSAGDLPPAYDALSVRQSTHHNTIQHTISSALSGPCMGSSSDPLGSDSAKSTSSALYINKSLPSRPSSVGYTPTSPKNATPVLPERPRNRKNTSWISLLPFLSSLSAKRVRQSVLSVVSDLVVPPSRVSSEERKNIHEILASIAETCTEHKLSLSTILQETSIADHTPMYWAIVNYREELLVALLTHSRPLSIQTISDIRRACLVSSNQALFHALRVRRPPFHKTDGIQVPSLRAASDNLLLGDRPLDEIHITLTTEQTFVVSFDIPLWQKRMKAIGQVNIEFIASGRMWCVTFFSTDPSLPTATSGKLRKATNTWHVMVSLLESSPPTYFDSQFIVDALLPTSIHVPRIREARSMAFPPSRDKRHQSRSSMYGYHSDEEGPSRLTRDDNALAPSGKDRYPSSSLSTPLPPIHPLRRLPPPVSIHLGCGSRKLGRRTGSGESSKPSETPMTKPDTWSDHGVGYTNAVVSPIGEGTASHLLYDHSQYLFPDGTLRGRLEVRLVKSESSKDCIIC